ncbi:hypothetical protein ANCCAN_16295 [Ancylostoma caninum]|uniref:IBR domain-containing protein n=1 Tax=Ancylostoma caninum TaxID=29170 RepID=A0A368G008_ANCCA|nr:hypothetical protein ANCCAN_16295 [Ancylostoma caninum]
MLELVPFCFDTTWIDPCRVSISGRLFNKAMLHVFFEEDRNRRILRVRVSTDSHYASTTSRDDLLHVIKERTRKEFPSLFPEIVEFITKRTIKGKEESEKRTSRFAMFSECFKAGVNSKKIAPLATKCGDREQLDYLHQFYAPKSSDSKSEARSEAEIPVKCCCCRLTNKTDLFLSHDGMICRECIASLITSQLRLNQFPLEIPIVTASGISPLELLYAIVPLPVVSLLLKKSFAFFNCLDYPHMVFVQCPNCLALLIVTEKCEFNSYSCTCSVCGCAWCYLCNWEPHWPMSCEQFKRWSERWDTQCEFNITDISFQFWVGFIDTPAEIAGAENLFDKDYIYSEKELRLCCDCETVYQVPGDSSLYPYLCPNYPNYPCGWNHTDDGQFYHRHTYESPLSPRMWQHIRALAADMKYCDECGIRTVGVLEAKRLIRKDVASICVEARNQRFEISKREDFERNMSKLFTLKAEQSEANDIRNTALYLVENCTAWLYLDGYNKHQRLKKAVATLFQKMLTLQHETWAPRDLVVMRVKELEEATDALINLFHQHTVTV